MFYGGDQYICPLCHKKMRFNNWDYIVSVFKCERCQIKYFVLGMNKFHASGMFYHPVLHTMYYNDKKVYTGSFADCCKALKLLSFT